MQQSVVDAVEICKSLEGQAQSIPLTPGSVGKPVT